MIVKVIFMLEIITNADKNQLKTKQLRLKTDIADNYIHKLDNAGERTASIFLWRRKISIPI